MINRRTRSRGIVAGLLLVLVGLALIVCSMPVFSLTREEIVEVPKSETIMDSSFRVHQTQDKIVKFQSSIGQELDIQATGNYIFNFSIANFLNPDNITQPDEPDVVYYSLENTTSVNTTWASQVRSAQPGNYCLVFLARDAPAGSPVQIYAKVTKNWTDIQTRQVDTGDRIRLIDPNFAYVGSSIAVLGVVILVVTLYLGNRPRNRRQS
jgi:hypothetical protein